MNLRNPFASPGLGRTAALLALASVALLGGAACSGPSWAEIDGTVTSALCGGAGPVAKPPAGAGMSGPITACRMGPISGARVVAASRDGQRFAGLTDAQGHYSINVPSGDYAVAVQNWKGGQTVTVTGYPGERRQANFAVTTSTGTPTHPVYGTATAAPTGSASSSSSGSGGQQSGGAGVQVPPVP